MLSKTKFLTATLLATSMFSASAAQIYWTDWVGGNGFTATGSITTPTSTVGVTYNNPQSYYFLQNGVTGDLADYFANGFFSPDRNPATSPYTSATVDNVPTAAEMVALYQPGRQTLHFSEAIANPVFAYVSLNGNGYGFDRDFDILSFGNPSDGNSCGFWGCGTSYKNVIDHGGGNFEYQLLGTGEPHGTIQFKGAFQDVTWNSLSFEPWNGFTVGVQGTAIEVFETPEPGSLALLGLGLLGLAALRGRKQA